MMSLIYLSRAKRSFGIRIKINYWSMVMMGRLVFKFSQIKRLKIIEWDKDIQFINDLIDKQYLYLFLSIKVPN